MGHATAASFDFHGIPTRPRGVAGTQSTWLRRFREAVVARLLNDQPPLAAARAYSYAIRALPVPPPPST